MGGIPTFLTPGIGNRFSDWVRAVGQGGPVSGRYMHRVAIVGSINLLSGPFQTYERLKLRRALAETRIASAPVFIIGHWRSGTTLLHNLLSLDPRFGFISTVQSLFPHSFITNPLFPWLTRVLMPATRPMDSMRLFVESPQEEEMALVNYGPWSMYHGWHFPRHLRTYYRQMVRFGGMGEKERQTWRDTYLHLLRTATLNAGGRRLVLKNPPHTARIPELLRLFPEARFIFLHRNPLEVYPSTRKLYRNVLPVFQLQTYDQDQIDRDIVWIYRDLLSAYLQDRELIEPGHLKEVMFTDLARRPLEIVEMLYETLDLGDFREVEPKLSAYLGKKQQKEYRPARYDLPKATLDLLEKEWGFAMEAWPNA